jgi:hypothetical protein
VQNTFSIQRKRGRNEPAKKPANQQMTIMMMSEEEGVKTKNSTAAGPAVVTMADGTRLEVVRTLKSRPQLNRAFSHRMNRGGTGGEQGNGPSMYFGIPSNQETRHYAGDTHGEDSWQFKLVLFIHSPPVQRLLMGLLVLDVGLLFLEMFLLATFVRTGNDNNNYHEKSAAVL